MVVFFDIPRRTFNEMRRHLLPRGTSNEQAGFVFAHTGGLSGDSLTFHFAEWLRLNRDDFAHQSLYHLELRDETRARVIKRAHDLQCSLIEFHSHPGPWPAQFSGSDFRGFDEFVPHVLWRLKGRPYAAAVVSPSGLDALAWVSSPREFLPVKSVKLGTEQLNPTGLSIKAIREGVAWNI
jgi:proteasome lid subunit RPN8/RPN11